MRKEETSKIFIKLSYVIKHVDKCLKKKKDGTEEYLKDAEEEEETNSIRPSKIFFDEEFRKKKNEKIIFEITLHNFFIVQNIMDKGEIKKKTLQLGTGWKYPRNPDIVNYSLSCFYKGVNIYEKKKLNN